MIKFYTIAFNRPDFLPLQKRALAHFITEDHRLIVINNGKGSFIGSVNAECGRAGLECVSVYNPRHDLGGESHIRAMDFALETFIRKDIDISVIIDHDIFPFEVTDLRRWLAPNEVAGLAQGKGHVKYLFPGLVILDTLEMPDKEAFSLHGGMVDDVQCDVGAQSCVYLRNHPQVKVRWMGTTGAIRKKDNNYLPDGFDGYEDDFEMEIIGERWLHHREGSNWNNKSPELCERKMRFIERFLNSRIRGRA